MFNFWSNPILKVIFTCLFAEEQREVDRQLKSWKKTSRETKAARKRRRQKLELEIKEIGQRGNEDMRLLAKQLVQLRKQKQRSYTANTAAMGAAGRAMSDMNRLIKPEELIATINAFLEKT
ncbi:hypothetical protein NQ317_011231 [Molorchus minor]|uniref:Uncharacterized protein n=1 Tax=Molorchus minor TaxID=1323400 RepID=A0ABQ9IPP7_9CUCU|nr:hypothetical protein NQ317_011231 [Molorchus minor]